MKSGVFFVGMSLIKYLLIYLDTEKLKKSSFCVIFAVFSWEFAHFIQTVKLIDRKYCRILLIFFLISCSLIVASPFNYVALINSALSLFLISVIRVFDNFLNFKESNVGFVDFSVF